MLEAKVDGASIQAGPDSPEVAQCPACGGEVRKRKRKVGRRGHTFFYRHKAGVGNDCLDVGGAVGAPETSGLTGASCREYVFIARG